MTDIILDYDYLLDGTNTLYYVLRKGEQCFYYIGNHPLYAVVMEEIPCRLDQ